MTENVLRSFLSLEERTVYPGFFEEHPALPLIEKIAMFLLEKYPERLITIELMITCPEDKNQRVIGIRAHFLKDGMLNFGKLYWDKANRWERDILGWDEMKKVFEYFEYLVLMEFYSANKVVTVKGVM